MTKPVIKDRFLVTDLAYGCNALGIVFTCYTDNDCHLTLNLCFGLPWFTSWYHKKRGVTMRHDMYMVKNVCATYEQNEPGDTIAHSFNITDIAWDHTYYWYLTAERLGVTLYSVSQVFTHQCPPPVTHDITCVTLVNGCYSARWANSWELAHSGPALAFGPGNMGTEFWHRNWAQYLIGRSSMRFDTTAIPPGSTILAAKIRLRNLRQNIQPYVRYGTPMAVTNVILNAPSCPYPASEACFNYLLGCTAQASSRTFGVDPFGDTWYEYPLTAAGKANIACGFTTVFGLRSLQDINDADPGMTQAWIDNKSGQGLPYEAYLDITYAEP